MNREEAIRILDRRSTIPDEDSSWLDIMQAINMAIEALKEQRPHGEWIDYTDDGYVECPFCGSATNCEDGGKEDLHYCFSCGAKLGGEEK